MTQQKLKLDELKVQSFVTDFDKEQDQTQEVNGGGSGQVFCYIYHEEVRITPLTDIWSLGCSYGCPYTGGFTDYIKTYEVSDIIQNRYQ